MPSLRKVLDFCFFVGGEFREFFLNSMLFPMLENQVLLNDWTLDCEIVLPYSIGESSILANQVCGHQLIVNFFFLGLTQFVCMNAVFNVWLHIDLWCNDWCNNKWPDC